MIDDKILQVFVNYSQIIVDVYTEEKVEFTAYDKKFAMFIPNDPTHGVFVYIRSSDAKCDVPHVLESTIKLGDEQYQFVCLSEYGSQVNMLLNLEDKVQICLDKLIQLFSLSSKEKIGEYQKEFMVYWNRYSHSRSSYSVYLEATDIFQNMNIYVHDSNVRLVGKGVNFNDLTQKGKDKKHIWIERLEYEAYYIPITNVEGIKPPNAVHQWNKVDVINIVANYQIDHISKKTFRMLEQTKPKMQNVILVFGMKVGGSVITFAMKVRFNNLRMRSLLERIQEDMVNVESLVTIRKDYAHMSLMIGNDLDLLNKSITVIGAGSLGSYVVDELAKNGARNIHVYDGDKLYSENVLRWNESYKLIGYNKANLMKFKIESIHPQVHALAYDRYLSDEDLRAEINNRDMLIFTIGSSDSQLHYNRLLKKLKCSVPVIYCWLEAGGEYSHILVVNYQGHGCYECLYTNEDGVLVPVLF